MPFLRVVSGWEPRARQGPERGLSPDGWLFPFLRFIFSAFSVPFRGIVSIPLAGLNGADVAQVGGSFAAAPSRAEHVPEPV